MDTENPIKWDTGSILLARGPLDSITSNLALETSANNALIPDRKMKLKRGSGGT